MKRPSISSYKQLKTPITGMSSSSSISLFSPLRTECKPYSNFGQDIPKENKLSPLVAPRRNISIQIFLNFETENYLMKLKKIKWKYLKI